MEAVCQKAFASLYGITISRVRRIAKATSTSICAPVDRWGKHPRASKRAQEDMKNRIRQHINSFPVVKAHYSKSKKRKYLSPQLSIAEMHRLYVKKFESDADNPLVKYSYYAKVFNTEFNLSFGTPKTDTCGTCESFKNKLALQGDNESRARVKADHHVHLDSANAFYASLRQKTKLAKQDTSVYTVTFDFQQNLPLPHLPVGDIFYMQQIWLFIFGVHSCGNNEATMYCWPEFMAKRGSDEVVSCLHNFFTGLPGSIKTLFLFSDGCPGQNKNSNVMSYLFTLVFTKMFSRITHTFPVRGHSYLPNDRDFGKTEMKKRKHERVYTCQQWMDIIRGARVRKPFKVVECDRVMFLDWQKHFSKFFKKVVKNMEKQALNISNARVLEYSDTHPNEVWVKYSLETPDTEWTKFTILKRGASPELPDPAQSQKYFRPVPLKENKSRDVAKIVDKYIPANFKTYYQDILSNPPATSDSD